MSGFSLESPRPQLPLNGLPFHQWRFPDGTLWTQFFRTNAGYLLRFPDLADFQVSSDGLSATCSPAPDVTDATSHHLYLNQVLPLMLSKQGKLVFHASAVEFADGAVAFAGESGRGKSTLAASFAASGFRFLTDDGLVLEACANGYQALPGYPSIRLWDDSESALLPHGAETAPALAFTSKARFLAGKHLAFCPQPQPLRRVYFLGNGSASEISFRRIHAAEALVEWVKHSFLLDIEEKRLLASHFDEVAKLANQPICYHLDYPRRFENLACVRRAIAEHATEQSVVV
ncbi:MAG: hypothetical protein IH605_14285 [Burkholderiales bacterium]|nr:hypothetical protein [Burkholderiales bacterium]